MLPVGTQVIVSPFELAGEVVQYNSKTVTVKCRSLHIQVCASQCRKSHAPPSTCTERSAIGVRHNLWYTLTDHTIDLHGMGVSEAVETLERWLDKIPPAHRKQLQIIHGKGSGRLKKAVRHALQKHTTVRRILELHPLAVNSGATWIETY